MIRTKAIQVKISINQSKKWGKVAKCTSISNRRHKICNWARFHLWKSGHYSLLKQMKYEIQNGKQTKKRKQIAPERPSKNQRKKKVEKIMLLCWQWINTVVAWENWCNGTRLIRRGSSVVFNFGKIDSLYSRISNGNNEIKIIIWKPIWKRSRLISNSSMTNVCLCVVVVKIRCINIKRWAEIDGITCAGHLVKHLDLCMWVCVLFFFSFRSV